MSLPEGIDNDLQFFCELGLDYTNSSVGLFVLHMMAHYGINSSMLRSDQSTSKIITQQSPSVSTTFSLL
jgi:hypothetical protein